MKRVNRSYTSEFRAAALEQVAEGGRSLPAVARSLEMSAKTLANWVLRARQGEPPAKASSREPKSELEADLTRLRQEVAKRRMEKEILKKAAAYFAKESM